MGTTSPGGYPALEYLWSRQGAITPTMRKWLILGALVMVGLAALGPLVWKNHLRYLGAPTPVAAGELCIRHARVEVSGTAHYPVRVKQTHQARWFSEERITWVFPLFPAGDTLGREIGILVASPEPPDPLLGFQDVTLTGRVRAPRGRVSRGVVRAFEEARYFFAEDLVLLEAEAGP